MVKQRNVLLVILSLSTLAFIESEKDQIQTKPNYEVDRFQKRNQIDSLSNDYKSIFQ